VVELEGMEKQENRWSE